MILGLKELREITQGAENIVKNENGFEFERFNKEEQALYATSTIGAGMHAPAGVQLEFVTDGTQINMSINTEICLDRSFFSVDIMCNETFIGSINNFDEEKMTGFYSHDKYPVGRYEGRFNIGKGENKVRIVLPWSVRTYIEKIEIENATYVKGVKKDKKILMYGDSITHGYDSIHSVNAYSVKIAYKLGAECFIKAVGGEKFWPELASIKSDKKPDYVTVAYGTNDWSSRTRDVFDKNSEEFLINLNKNYKDSKIFVITPIWRKDHTNEGIGFGDIHYVEQKLRSICGNIDNAVCIRGWELVPHEEKCFGDLRLHPNDDGFTHYADNLLQQIQKHI